MPSVPSSSRSGHHPRALLRVWILLALWGFLVIQFAADTVLTLVSSEPFPTVTMPAFSGERIDRDGSARITTRTVEVIARDGSPHVVEPAELLSPLYSVPAGVTLDRLLKPVGDREPELPAEAVDWLKDQTYRFGGTSSPVGLRVIWQSKKLDLRTLSVTATDDPVVREVDSVPGSGGLRIWRGSRDTINESC